MLISDDYRTENLRLHAKHVSYGAHGSRWAPRVRALYERAGCRDALDYGCGKGTLAQALPDLPFAEYDPAIPGKDRLPEPADLVTCTDVLEHIEPDNLDSVLGHLASLARKAAFFNISTRLAAKVLDSGRNAHLIVKDSDWWRARIEPLFDIEEWEIGTDEVNCELRPKDSAAWTGEPSGTAGA
ncbi:methyltransferase domain-containing protein [Rubellimicrobium aerolatum]|uniref:Methyltransferase domain-containing protein n=1 Tax=Rubellimicrobium aerolatum TaxID=490979 RepID=A0ABW0S5Y0_9RHOB|nr:methyltransferase domain-containing protein [Rubellimicrobium aerolatum]MBP1804576.1 hypothetical protein [Rubellimicrobium aerolatum]